MNEKITLGNEIAAEKCDMLTVIRRIMERALLTRPRKSVYYRPYHALRFIRFEKALSAQNVDLNVLYPEAEEGDIAFVDFQIATEVDYDIYLNIQGNVNVAFEGIEKICCFEKEVSPQTAFSHEMFHIPISVKKGQKNAVRVACVKHGKEFGFRFVLSVKRYPTMWANDYLYAARALSPLSAYSGEEGVAVSACIKTGKTARDALRNLPEWNGYCFPTVSDRKNMFDFNQLCETGDVCYVYTEAERKQEIQYDGTVTQVFVNKKQIPVFNGSIWAEQGDEILFKCVRQSEKWFLNLPEDGLRLSFLTSGRQGGDRAIFIGPFYGDKLHAPEYDWVWADVFTNEKGQKLYWKFCDGSQMRIYLDSVFFGQWFYALMVGFYGIRRAAQILGDEQRQRLFCENMSFMAKYFNYIVYDIECNAMPAFMPRIAELDVLDNIGTMGMNFIDAYFDCNEKSILPLIERIARQMEETIPRFPDGTFYRRDTMWADDLYMSCPFLVRMGQLSGDYIWYEKATAQIKGFAKRLYMEDEKLFSHIYFPDVACANRVPWGRGNGWVMWTLSELLMAADGKIEIDEPLRLFQEIAVRLQELQDESGLWRQVLNCTQEESYLETSCTAMFLLAFTRGVKYGWLNESFLTSARKAWTGLMGHSIDQEGNVYGVCMGSGCAMEAEYYFSIPTIINDDHGTGIVLAAASELYDLLREKEQLG